MDTGAAESYAKLADYMALSDWCFVSASRPVELEH